MPSLKEAYQLIYPQQPTGYMDLKGIQPVNFTIDNDSAPVTNLTDLTLDGDGKIIGVFAGKVHISYALEGAETTINTVINKHNNFGDTTSSVPVFELVRSKDIAADPIGDNFVEENVIATSVTIDPATDGTVILNFDGYIIPIVPRSTILKDPASLDFGEQTVDTSEILSFELSWSNPKEARPAQTNMVVTFPSKRQGCLTEDGVYESSLEVTPNADNSPTVIYVKYTPTAAVIDDDVITLEAEGFYTEEVIVLGTGII